MSDVQFQLLLSELHALKGNVNKRFDTIDERFETMDKRFDVVEGDIKEIKGEVKEMKEQLKRIETWTPYNENQDIIANLEAIKYKH